MRLPTCRAARAVLVLLAAGAVLASTGTLHAQRRQQPSPPPRGARGDSAGGDSSRRASPLAGLKLRSIGPALISGRIVDLAVHPRDKRTWYIATASGGVWKTTNAGTTWMPIFDGEGSYSTGAIAIDPTNPNVVWVGTGENNAQRSVSYGDGVYKSEDGGTSWKNVGLKASEHIGKILIDPRNSDVVYVAAQGPLSRAGGDRGLYKTTDGGATWNRVLDSGTWAGANDVVLDPRNPDILIATMWQRYRRVYGYVAGGPESGVYRSTDAGKTWHKSQRGLPNNVDLGRIGLAVSPANPDVVYAIIEAANDKGGFYRSRDGGASWQRMSGHNTIGLYYDEIFADPHDVDRVYSVDTRNMVTEDGGKTFHPVGEKDKHVDNHVIWIDPDDADHLLIGCDGGLYESFDRGQTYTWFSNLPLGQFYRVDLDNAKPFYNVYGGTQDNNSLGGPSATRAPSGITNADWFITAGGDGFQSRADPEDPTTVYAESQYGVLQRFNLKTGEVVSIQPQEAPGDSALRWYWDSPLIVSPHAHTRLYFAAQRLYRSDDRGDTWRAVSPDLTRQIDRNTLKMMDRVWSVDAVAKNASSSFFGEIVALAESPLVQGQLWVGTDDGLVQVSPDGGTTWRKTEHFPGVPDTTFVAQIRPSSHDSSTAFVAFDGHMSGDFAPYLLKTTDLGKTWTSIADDLPKRGTVYTVIDDPVDPNLLFAGTEFGLFVTRDGGKNWTRMRGGLPTIMVHDLAIQKRDDDLVLATFGRSFYVLDDIAPLRAATPELMAKDAALFAVPTARMYIPSNTLAGGYTTFLGGDHYSADNPPFGAVFTYYLKSELRTHRDKRLSEERKTRQKGGDVFYPSWDSLKVEDREEPPAIILSVRDADGNVIRRITGPTGAGIHRVAWDLRFAPPVVPRGRGGEDEGEAEGFRRGPTGPMVLPGTYEVSLAKRVDGVVTPLGTPQKFTVEMLDTDLPARSADVVAFQRKASGLQRAMLGAAGLVGELRERTQMLERAIRETPGAGDSLAARAHALVERVRDAQEALTGDPTMARRNEPTPPSLMGRMSTMAGWTRTMGAPTATQQEQYDILNKEFTTLLGSLKTLAETELPRVEQAAETAGVPWTTGRVPSWNGQ